MNHTSQVISGTPFSPRLYEVAGTWHYEDGRMLASVQFGPLPPDAANPLGEGEGLRILEWMCNDKGKGCSVEALEWLRRRFKFITADSVGLADEEGMHQPALAYWVHMHRRGLVDELIDDIGRRLVVTADNVHTLPHPSDLETWAPSQPLVHIGTLDPKDKGVRGDSYEGHGLSVSECPEAWEAIAKLGGQPWWELLPRASAAEPRFLDWHATPREQREAMLAWAEEQGLVEPCAGFRVHHYDHDHAETVFVNFENEADARRELKWMLEEHEEEVDALEMMPDDGQPGPAPYLEQFDGWKLTDLALARLHRTKADLGESSALAALLYVESQTDLAGLYWADTLDVASLSAPRAVIFPSRLTQFEVALRKPVNAAGKRSGAIIMHSEPLDTLERAIFQAVESGSDKALMMHLERTPARTVQLMLPLIWKEFNGTLLYRSLTRAVMFAESTFGSGHTKHGGLTEFVESNAACADLLRALGAPCHSKETENAAAGIFLAADWGSGASAAVIERLMRDSIAAGDFGVDTPMPYVGTECDGVLPLQAAFKFGNAQAAQALLDAGASLSAPLEGTTYTDIVAYAASFNAPRSREVASVMAHALMSRQLADASRAPAADTAPTNSTDSDSDAGTLKKGRGRRMGV